MWIYKADGTFVNLGDPQRIERNAAADGAITYTAWSDGKPLATLISLPADVAEIALETVIEALKESIGSGLFDEGATLKKMERRRLASD